MELNNNTLIIDGATHRVTRGGNTQTISDTSWDAYFVPVLYPPVSYTHLTLPTKRIV